MKKSFRWFLVFVAIISSGNGQSPGSTDPLEGKGVEDDSKFQKFLHLFGIGSSKQFPVNAESQQQPQYSPYGYPCGISTTTTPAPLMNPLLCPYPPPQPHGKPVGDGHIQQVPHPGDHLGPHVGGIDSHGRPPPSYPGFLPQYPNKPSGLPPPIMIPLQPGQTPPPGFVPVQVDHPYPGQLYPNPGPAQNYPPHLNPSGHQNGPPIPILIPGNIEQAETGPEPVKVFPTNAQQPYDPVKVNPATFNPSKPLHVNPVEVEAPQPTIVHPTNNSPVRPLHVDPLQPYPTFNGDSFLDYNDPKAFSRYPAVSPFGPTNVLINPGFPDPPPTTPAPTTLRPTTIPPTAVPQRIPNGTLVQPFTVLLNPGLPVDPPPQHLLNLPHTGFINAPNGLLPFTPSDASPAPENIHLIPILPSQPLPSHLQYPPSLLTNQTLPPPPGNYSLPPPLPNNDGPRPFVDPVAAPQEIPSQSQVPPFPFPNLPGQILPEQTRPPCGSPYLKPYVPQGFHLSSVNQFIGMPAVPNQRFNFPCPTLDVLQSLDFSVMRSLIVSSGLLPLFDHTKNYTLFVPSDAAFRRLPRWFRDSLEVDKKLKKALILNHLVKEDLPLSILENEELILSARPGGNRLRVNIYQPSNAYRTVTIDGAEVEKGDILTSNGRVHILNKVVMPNLPRNAAQFLSEKLEFESFWNLVKQAGYVDNFQDTRPFTVFIPVNEAVQRLADPSFLADKEKIINFINYHVVNGTYYSNGLVDNEFLLTNYEKEIKMQVTSDSHTKSLRGVNGGVRVLKSDISLTNGVAHIIERCISDETPFYVYPQSDEFKNEYGVLRRAFKVTGQEKNIEKAF